MSKLENKSANVAKALDSLQNEVNNENKSIAIFEKFVDDMFKKALVVLNNIAERAEDYASDRRADLDKAEEVLKKYGRN